MAAQLSLLLLLASSQPARAFRQDARADTQLRDNGRGASKITLDEMRVKFKDPIDDGGDSECIKPGGKMRPHWSEYMMSCRGERYPSCPSDKPFLVYKEWHYCCVKEQPYVDQCCIQILEDIVEPAIGKFDAFSDGSVLQQYRHLLEMKREFNCNHHLEATDFWNKHGDSYCKAMLGRWKSTEVPDRELSIEASEQAEKHPCLLQGVVLKSNGGGSAAKVKGKTGFRHLGMVMEEDEKNSCGPDAITCLTVASVKYSYDYKHRNVWGLTRKEGRSIEIAILKAAREGGAWEDLLVVTETDSGGTGFSAVFEKVDA